MEEEEEVEAASLEDLPRLLEEEATAVSTAQSLAEYIVTETPDNAADLVRVLARHAQPHPVITQAVVNLLACAPQPVALVVVDVMSSLCAGTEEEMALIMDVYGDLLGEDRSLIVPVLGSLADLPLTDAQRKQVGILARESLQSVEEADLPALARVLLRVATKRDAPAVVAALRAHARLLATGTLVLLLEALDNSLQVNDAGAHAYMEAVRASYAPLQTLDVLVVMLLLRHRRVREQALRAWAAALARGTVPLPLLHNLFTDPLIEAVEPLAESVLVLATHAVANRSVFSALCVGAFAALPSVRVDVLRLITGLLNGTATTAREQPRARYVWWLQYVPRGAAGAGAGGPERGLGSVELPSPPAAAQTLTAVNALECMAEQCADTLNGYARVLSDALHTADGLHATVYEALARVLGRMPSRDGLLIFVQKRLSSPDVPDRVRGAVLARHVVSHADADADVDTADAVVSWAARALPPPSEAVAAEALLEATMRLVETAVPALSESALFAIAQGTLSPLLRLLFAHDSTTGHVRPLFGSHVTVRGICAVWACFLAVSDRIAQAMAAFDGDGDGDGDDEEVLPLPVRRREAWVGVVSSCRATAPRVERLATAGMAITSLGEAFRPDTLVQIADLLDPPPQDHTQPQLSSSSSSAAGPAAKRQRSASAQPDTAVACDVPLLPAATLERAVREVGGRACFLQQLLASPPSVLRGMTSLAATVLAQAAATAREADQTRSAHTASLLVLQLRLVHAIGAAPEHASALAQHVTDVVDGGAACVALAALVQCADADLVRVTCSAALCGVYPMAVPTADVLPSPVLPDGASLPSLSLWRLPASGRKQRAVRSAFTTARTGLLAAVEAAVNSPGHAQLATMLVVALQHSTPAAAHALLGVVQRAVEDVVTEHLPVHGSVRALTLWTAPLAVRMLLLARLLLLARFPVALARCGRFYTGTQPCLRGLCELLELLVTPVPPPQAPDHGDGKKKKKKKKKRKRGKQQKEDGNNNDDDEDDEEEKDVVPMLGSLADKALHTAAVVVVTAVVPLLKTILPNAVDAARVAQQRQARGGRAQVRAHPAEADLHSLARRLHRAACAFVDVLRKRVAVKPRSLPRVVMACEGLAAHVEDAVTLYGFVLRDVPPEEEEEDIEEKEPEEEDGGGDETEESSDQEEEDEWAKFGVI